MSILMELMMAEKIPYISLFLLFLRVILTKDVGFNELRPL
ncbi:hypothetical protein CZ814_02699 [Photobacterium toruni]|uniref:Uncharacterized protein n=1 Tax=Photobacterium toruni TaxID=1935446 RepID=A0A1T4U3N6_9GAMM|nr:hypothetical protein CZ814_02699 [Photobacterium toruni]